MWYFLVQATVACGMPLNYKTKKINMTNAKMKNNDIFSKRISSSINFRNLYSNKADLKTQIKRKEIEIWSLNEILKRKDKTAKKKEEIIFKKFVKVQKLEILTSLNILKSKDPKKAEQLCLKLENLLNGKFEEQKLKTRKFLDCIVSEPEHEGITPRNSNGEPYGAHSDKLVYLVLLN